MKRMRDAKDVSESGDEAENIEILAIVDVCKPWL